MESRRNQLSQLEPRSVRDRQGRASHSDLFVIAEAECDHLVNLVEGGGVLFQSIAGVG